MFAVGGRGGYWESAVRGREDCRLPLAMGGRGEGVAEAKARRASS